MYVCRLVPPRGYRTLRVLFVKGCASRLILNGIPGHSLNGIPINTTRRRVFVTLLRLNATILRLSRAGCKLFALKENPSDKML